MERKSKDITCKLTTTELKERKKTIIADMKRLVVSRIESKNGTTYKFEDSESAFSLLTDFIKTERLCCDFFTFKLIIGEQEGYFTLELSGPEGTKEFIEAEIGF